MLLKRPLSSIFTSAGLTEVSSQFGPNFLPPIFSVPVRPIQLSQLSNSFRTSMPRAPTRCEEKESVFFFMPRWLESGEPSTAVLLSAFSS